MIEFEMSLLGGPFDGAKCTMELDNESSAPEDEPLTLKEGHIYHLTMADKTFRYVGKA